GAEVDDRRAQKSLADEPHLPGTTRARVLLEEEHLLHERQAPPAVLLWPRDPVPPRAPERTLPLEPLVEQGVLVARTAAAAHDRELTLESRREPLAGLGPEGFVFGAEAKVHSSVLIRGEANLPSARAEPSALDHPRK